MERLVVHPVRKRTRGRLSRDDDLAGDSNSIVNQENICQGGFHHKDEIPPLNKDL